MDDANEADESAPRVTLDESAATARALGAVVESEFASVAVRLDAEGNSVRLRVEDLRTGRVRHLDALELETVVWLEDGHLTQLLDPSHERWRG